MHTVSYSFKLHNTYYLSLKSKCFLRWQVSADPAQESCLFGHNRWFQSEPTVTASCCKFLDFMVNAADYFKSLNMEILATQRRKNLITTANYAVYTFPFSLLRPVCLLARVGHMEQVTLMIT